MSTLAVVEQILRETQVPMSVKGIVEQAGGSLPTKSKTPDTVVARDLSMDIKRKGEGSIFIRTSPGRYTMREFVTNGIIKMSEATSAVASAQSVQTSAPAPSSVAQPLSSPAPTPLAAEVASATSTSAGVAPSAESSPAGTSAPAEAASAQGSVVASSPAPAASASSTDGATSMLNKAMPHGRVSTRAAERSEARQPEATPHPEGRRGDPEDTATA